MGEVTQKHVVMEADAGSKPLPNLQNLDIAPLGNIMKSQSATAQVFRLRSDDDIAYIFVAIVDGCFCWSVL